jgi:hypothetical protein
MVVTASGVSKRITGKSNKLEILGCLKALNVEWSVSYKRSIGAETVKLERAAHVFCNCSANHIW